jgi:predicted CXXCH cytochrome family protein
VSCKDCHPQKYSDWSQSGHAFALNASPGSAAPSYPYYTVSSPPSGYSWNDVTYVQGGYYRKANFIESGGYIMTGPGRQFNLSGSSFVQYTATAYPPGLPYDDSCARCHTTGWQPSATNHQDGLPGIMGTWFEAGVTCEACHRLSDGTGIVLDNSAALCGSCHARADGGQVEVIGGLLANYEQYDELMNSPMSSLKCQDCHNPHKNTVRNGGGLVISPVCIECHPSRIIRPGGHAAVPCVDCHMPPVVRSAMQSGSGNYLKGDTRTHIFRIDRTKNPADMFYSSGGRTYANGFLTVREACLYCHNGTDASYLDVTRAKGVPVVPVHTPY